jgi:hypothetical protein
MNPRKFCREYPFPRVLALTYSFDPLFFERIILKDLGHGGSTDITVVGDRNELQDAVARYSGQLNYLGKTYLLAPAETNGAFHPKLLLRVGNQGARLILGSGNLTFGGWGGNRELTYRLNLDAAQTGSASIVNHLLDHVTPYLTSEAGRNALDRLRDYSWLSAADEPVSNILMTTPNEPLAAQLQRRWAGRRFNRMVVLTGSTDERGAFIDWCHKQFGIEECVVAVSPENASFVKSDIDRSPVKVSLAPFIGSSMLHAKFYWFEGPDGAAAIVGSANCSSAAWLRSPVQGGNVEIVKIYDAADDDNFGTILSAIPAERVDVARGRTADAGAEEKIAPPYFVNAIHLHRSQGCMDITLNRPLPTNAIARLITTNGIEISLLSGDNGLLSGPVPETISFPEITCLAKVEIVLDDEVVETPLHWIDDIDAIIRASHSKPPAEPFKNLSRSQTSSEHDKVILDLAMISVSIFSESAAYRDPPRRRALDQQNQNQRLAEPVRAEDLIKSLNDLEIRTGDLVRESGAGVYLSMNGVMRALFEEVESLPLIESEAATANPDALDGVPAQPERGTAVALPNPNRQLPAGRHRQRLKEELDKFFTKFSSETFSRECTVSKLVQAAAYPLAVALLGERGGWLRSEESRAIVTRVVDILLNRNTEGRKERGILEEVRNRYKEMDQEDIFLQVVGDGTLRVVLLAVMAQLTWEEDFEKFERAINLHRIYGCDAMRSDTTVFRLTALLQRLDIERARELVIRDAPRISTAIDAIEKLMGESRETLLQEASTQEHRVGDFIWNPATGWGVVKGISSASSMDAYLHLRGETRKVMKKNFFVNLRIAAEQSKELKQYLSETGVGL